MNAEEIIKIINDIERKFNVDNWIIDDLHVWPLIRIDLMFNLYYTKLPALQNEVDTYYKIKNAANILKGTLKYLYSSIIDYKNNDKLSKVDVLFISDTDSRVLIDKKWYNRHCRPFIDYFNNKDIKTISLEKSHRYLIPRSYKSIYIQLRLDYELMKSMFIVNKKIKKIKLEDYDKFLKYLNDKKLNIPIPDINRLKIIVLAVNSYSNYFTQILNITKPAIGFTVSYHNPVCMAFNLSCRRFGIPSIDIQHGVQGDYNAGYGRWLRVPVAGYELLPSIFWCWSKDEADSIEKWSKKVQASHKAIVGGNLFLDLWRVSGSKLAKKHDREFLKINNAVNKYKNILVTLSADDNIKFINDIVPVMNELKNDYKWWIRLHPCSMQKKDEINKILIDSKLINFDIDNATDFPLYALLRHMDLHITQSSAAVFEAESFGVPSIVTSYDAKSYFSKQILKGTAIYANNAETIKKILTGQLQTKIKKRRKNECQSKVSIRELDKLINEIRKRSLDIKT